MGDPLWSAAPHGAPTEARADRPVELTGRLDHPVGGESPGEERWGLPAAPLAHVLSTLRADTYMADGDLATFARGLGLDADLTRSVLAGDRDQLSGDEVASVCAALGCSPFDIWEKGRLADVQDEGRWAPGIETEDPGDHEFVRRRLDQQVRDMVSIVDAAPRPPTPDQPMAVEVTCYRQSGVLAVDPTGHRFVVSDLDQPVQPGTDYHFTFQRVGGTETVTAPLTAVAFADGSPAGHGVEPRLASLAESLDPGADMVRFRDPATGVEQWIGRETPFDVWESWDDPRTSYPGDPADVLDDRSVADHPELPFESPVPENFPAGIAELNDGLTDVDGFSIDL